MEQKIEVKANENGETRLLTGTVLNEKAPHSIEISGVLGAPAQFLKDKSKNYKQANCHALVEEREGRITFIGNDKDPYSRDIVTGKLTRAKVLEAFSINTGNLRTVTEMVTFLKRNRFWFSSADEHAAILKNLQNFSATVTAKIAQSQNNNGSASNSWEREVGNIDWNREFVLNIPVYEGYPNKLFRVEVVVDATDRAVKFALESTELYELDLTLKAELIKSEIEPLVKFGCSIVYIN
jgi:hypothetical protein